MSDAQLLPCATCPWRVDKDAATIPRYVHGKACGLLGTVGDQDAFRAIMACHHSGEDDAPRQRVCRGYLAQAGWSNLNVRLLCFEGRMASPDQVAAACARAGVRLEPDYPTVLRKLEASLEPTCSRRDRNNRLPDADDARRQK